jgi:chromosomal replication initiation ATPase DnaA
MSKRQHVIDGELYIRADLIKSDELDVPKFAAIIIDAVAKVSGVSSSQITGRSGAHAMRYSRVACCVLMKERRMGWREIASAMERRNHSTVLKQMDKWGDHPETKRIVRAARKRLMESEAE